MVDLSVDQILGKEMVRLGGNFLIERVFLWLSENPGKNLTLSEAASLIGKSNSYLSHLFTDVYGKSFTEVLGSDNRVSTMGHGRYAVKSVWRPKEVKDDGRILNSTITAEGRFLKKYNYLNEYINS